MTTIARLAVVAVAAVAGAAVTDVIWRGRYLERDREWRDRFVKGERIQIAIQLPENYGKTGNSSTDGVARDNSGRATRRTA